MEIFLFEIGIFIAMYESKSSRRKLIDDIACLVCNVGIGEHHWPYLMRFDAKNHNHESIMEKSIESKEEE